MDHRAARGSASRARRGGQGIPGLPKGQGSKFSHFEEQAGYSKRNAKRFYVQNVQGVDEQWSMDFVTDRLEDGRIFSVLSAVDNFSREYLRTDRGRTFTLYCEQIWVAPLLFTETSGAD